MFVVEPASLCLVPKYLVRGRIHDLKILMIMCAHI